MLRTMTRRARATLALTTAVSLLAPASGAAAAPTTRDPAAAAAGWLAGRLVEGKRLQTSYGGSTYDDAGLTADAVLGLAGARVAADAVTRATDWLATQVGTYTGSAPEAYAGATAKLLLVATTAGRDPRAFGGTDLVAKLQARELPTGRFSDQSAYGDYSNVITQSLALLALHRVAGVTPSTASVQYLVDRQCPDGGFPLSLTAATCNSGPDPTAFAVQALVAVGRTTDADEAIAYLRGAQRADGSFAVGGVGNANSTGLAAAALSLSPAAADDAAEARAFLVRLQDGCAAGATGKVVYAEGDTGDVQRATAQALLGLAAVNLATVTSAGATTGAPTLDCTTGGGGGTGSGGGVPPSGSGHGDGHPSASDPLHVQASGPGGVRVTVRDAEVEVVGDAVRLGRVAAIEAPAASVEDPHVLTFTVDRSLVWAAARPGALGIERDGVRVPDCSPGSTGATPDPCLASRSVVDADLRLVVRTTRGSEWAVLAATDPCVGVSGPRFTDVAPDDVHADAIGCVAGLDVARGRTADRFEPSEALTRGQLASLLVRTVEVTGRTLPVGEDRFRDDDGTTHERAIDALAAAGIMLGTSATTSDPDAPVTRAQATALVVRTLEHLTGESLPDAPDRFRDDDGTTHERTIDRAAAAGLVSGIGADRFAPSRLVTRAQAASVLTRALGRSVVADLQG